MLDKLDSIEWARLQHAYGAAVDVPQLLRDLLVASKREAAIDTLWGNVFHQGSVWQVSAKVVPFLLEILDEGPADPDLQRFLLDYLHHLALGYPDDMPFGPIDPVSFFAVASGLKDEGRVAELADFATHINL